MDYYSTRTPDNYSLIKGIFIILMIAVGIGLILFLTLNINLTTKGKNGQIISQNAPIQYLSPYDAQVNQVFVKEGDFVKKGDTLVLLQHTKFLAELESNSRNLTQATINIEIYEEQLNNLKQKMNRQKKEIGILKRRHNNKRRGTSFESGNLKEQLDFMEDKLKISKTRVEKSKKMLRSGAISEKEYDQRYQEYLEESSRFAKLKNRHYQQDTNKTTLDDDHDELMSKQKLSILNTESELLERKKAIEQEKTKREQILTKIAKAESEIDKLQIVAEIDGYATNIFNTKKEVNLVTKNQALVMIAPSSEEQFYVNMKVPEEEIKDIKIGQTVHIKVNAFNHYQYGVLKGKVTYIDKEVAQGKPSSTRPPEQFYILADIPIEETEKMNLQNGLKAEGEIILQRVKLYQYVMNSMFKKM